MSVENNITPFESYGNNENKNLTSKCENDTTEGKTPLMDNIKVQNENKSSRVNENVEVDYKLYLAIILFCIIFLIMLTKIILMIIFTFFTVDFFGFCFLFINFGLFLDDKKKEFQKGVAISIFLFGFLPCFCDIFVINTYKEVLNIKVLLACEILSIINTSFYLILLILYYLISRNNLE